MTKLARILIPLAALTAATSALQAQPAPTPAPAPAAKKAAPGGSAFTPPEVKRWKLDNGLEVFHASMKDAPVVTVQVYYHVGSKDDPEGKRGSARLFEQLMFKGSARVREGDHARMIDGLGGETSAFTAWDVTGFVNTVPREHLDFAVQLEAERMRGLLFRDTVVTREREVVKQQKRMREGNALAASVEALSALAFTKHPYAYSPYGVPEELASATVDSLKSFYDLYYQPGNAALVVVGDVSEADVRASAQKWFGKVPAAKTPPPRPADDAAEPEQTEPRRVNVDQAAGVGIVIGGFHIPASKSPDLVPLKLAASILTDGESARLKQRVVQKDKIAVGAGGQVLALEHPGLLFVFTAFLKPEEAARCTAAITDEIGKLGKGGPTARELEKAKNQMAARFVFGLESVTGVAQQIGMSWINTGDPSAWLAEYDAILAVSAADVKRVVKSYLKPSAITLMVVPPQAGGAP